MGISPHTGVCHFATASSPYAGLGLHAGLMEVSGAGVFVTRLRYFDNERTPPGEDRMTTRKATRHRSERVEARVTPEQKKLLERAAALAGRSLTDFVLSSAQAAAVETISRHELLELTPEDQDVFVAALMKPPAPNEALRAAAARYLATRGR